MKHGARTAQESRRIVGGVCRWLASCIRLYAAPRLRAMAPKTRRLTAASTGDRSAPGESPVVPLASFPPRAPTHTGRAPEFYGFVAWVTTSIAWVLFLLWALIPDEWIHWTGIHWYPSRYEIHATPSQWNAELNATGNGPYCCPRGQSCWY